MLVEWLLIRATNRVRAPWFWRVLYRALASRALVGLVASLVRRADKGRITGLEDALVWSGWPRRPRGWVNINASQFVRRVRDRVNGRRLAPRVVRARKAGPLRVACLGDFSALLTFQPELFEAAPTGIEVSVFDLPSKTTGAGYLAPLVARYEVAPTGEPGRARQIAAAINEVDPDLLLVVSTTLETHDVLDVARAHCVAHVCTGSDLLHHRNVDIQLYAQPEADYFVRDNRVFCGTSRSFLKGYTVYAADLLYDGRGLDPSQRRPWHERDALVVVHGSLYKSSAPGFLATVLDLVGEDAVTRAVFVGDGVEEEREAILVAAGKRGLEARVEVRPPYSAVRGTTGSVESAGWHSLVELLSRARLAADPWPIGGASSRVEAYGCGAPTVHMGVRFDPDSWGRDQPAVFELPALLVPIATASSPEEYVDLCRRCLNDAEFSDEVAARQEAVFRRVTDPAIYWEQLLGLHRRWLDAQA
jgi:hypothetical protein